MRVLVVESNEAARDRMRTALDSQYVVRFAGGVREAMAAMREQPPDLVVSEVDLGEGTGFQLCEQVRGQADLRWVPILLLTNRSSTTDKVAGFQAGADDYVVKPLDPRLFPARLRLLSRIKRIETPSLSGD